MLVIECRMLAIFIQFPSTQSLISNSYISNVYQFTCYIFQVAALLLSEELIAGNCWSHLCFTVHSLQWHMICMHELNLLSFAFISVLFCVWLFFLVIDCKQWKKCLNKVPMHHYCLLMELDPGSPIWTSLSNILLDLCSLHAQRRYTSFLLSSLTSHGVVKWKGDVKKKTS